MRISTFLAKRLYAHKNEGRRVSRPAIQIATIGIAVGLIVMILAMCVVLGFKQEIRNKIVGFGAHIEILNHRALQLLDSHPIALSDTLMAQLRGIDEVNHIQRFCNRPGMLKTTHEFKGVVFKGVGEDYDLSYLKQNLVAGTLPEFGDTVASHQLVISQQMAAELELEIGQQIYAYFFDSNVRARRFEIAAIYCTNLNDFDQTIVITDIYTTQRLNGWEFDQVSGVEIMLTHYDNLESKTIEVAQHVKYLQDKYGNSYATLSIHELHPQFFAWLDLLDLNVWVILGLMISVAVFTMISGLLIIILERTNFIGILKALGATNRTIRHLFLKFATFIIVRALLWGNAIGILLVLLQQHLNIVRLNPATYYVDSVPMYLNLGLLVLLNIVTLFISVVVLLLPSILISHIHPAKSIRFE